MSTTDTKVMLLQSEEPIRTRIMISDRILEKVRYFNYLGNDRNIDIDVKLGKFQTVVDGVCVCVCPYF